MRTDVRRGVEVTFFASGIETKNPDENSVAACGGMICRAAILKIRTQFQSSAARRIFFVVAANN
jgi:hypothetical protein